MLNRGLNIGKLGCQPKDHERDGWFDFTVTSPVQEGRDDDALVDFQAAAAEGSGFAKSMLVEMNPYAAMCNAMLR